MKRDIKDSLERIVQNTADETDERTAEYWLHQLHQNDNADHSKEELEQISRQMWAKLPIRDNRKSRLITLWPRIAAAVSIIFAVLSVGYFYFSNKTRNQAIVYNNDVDPGGFAATLTLADGKKIRLADVKNGKLAEQAGIRISKKKDGQLIYEISDGNIQDNGINTLSTNKGETYQVVLSDGTKVWLNAGSKLSYATKLIKDDKRSVELEGEGYFEVAKDASHPFLVTSDGQTVQVLGTHFNIKAYRDEPTIRTTLLEGSIKLKTGNQERLLVPGQQANLSQGHLNVVSVPANDVIAWKNGEFVFEDDDLSYIMQQLSRWYDIEVSYENQQLKKEKFRGTFNRFERVGEALKVMERTGLIHFSIDGRKITVK